MLLKLLIRIYWMLPPKHRRQCLFKETCSRYVYRVTTEKGFIDGLKALLSRYKTCRSSYAIYTCDNGKEWVILQNQSIVERELTNI